MNETENNSADNTSSNKTNVVSFLKVDALKRGSHALSLFLKTNDIIVGLDKQTFRGTQKSLTESLKEKPKSVLTILRKNTLFNVLAKGPLGIVLVETGSDEDAGILQKVKEYHASIDSFENYKEYEVFKGKNNIYDIIKVNDGSLFASLFPLVWFFHYRLYLPLLLIIMLFLLLSTVAWWLFLSSWVILTIYMSKGSMSLLRGYCMFNEMRITSKIYSNSFKSVQLIIREQFKKSNFVFPEIEPPVNEDEENNSNTKENSLSAQTS